MPDQETCNKMLREQALPFGDSCDRVSPIGTQPSRWSKSRSPSPGMLGTRHRCCSQRTGTCRSRRSETTGIRIVVNSRHLGNMGPGTRSGHTSPENRQGRTRIPGLSGTRCGHRSHSGTPRGARTARPGCRETCTRRSRTDRSGPDNPQVEHTLHMPRLRRMASAATHIQRWRRKPAACPRIGCLGSLCCSRRASGT